MSVTAEGLTGITAVYDFLDEDHRRQLKDFSEQLVLDQLRAMRDGFMAGMTTVD